MSSPVPSGDLFVSDSYEQHWDPYDDASQQQTQANKLEFCQFLDWDSERIYDEDPPSHIHYLLNRVEGDSEQQGNHAKGHEVGHSSNIC